MTDNTALRASALSTFSFQSSFSIRAILIDGTPWFVAKDVFTALGLTWKGSDSLSMIPEDWRMVRKLRTTLANQHGEHGEVEKDAILITEPAVYKIAFRSNKPEADAFTNRVAEIITEIRQTGRYQVAAPAPEVETLSAQQYDELTRALRPLYGLLNNESVQTAIHDHVRVTLGVRHLKDIPAAKFAQAMLLAKDIRARCEIIGRVGSEFIDEMTRAFIAAEAPCTLVLARQYKQRFKAEVPKYPNWLEIQRQLQTATQAPVLALD
jgi:prophage antirepressor-like protein